MTKQLMLAGALLATVLTSAQAFPPVAAPKPPLANPDSVTIREDTSVTLSPLDNDVSGHRTPFIINVPKPRIGEVHFTPKSITYTPHPNAHGRDVFRYTITDGAGQYSTALVTVTVSPVEDPPRIGQRFPYLARLPEALSSNSLPGHGGLYDTIRPNEVAIFDLTSRAFDAEGPVAVVAVDSMSRHGGTVTKISDTEYIYCPNRGGEHSEQPLSEWDSFGYTIEDSAGNRATGSVYIHIAHASHDIDEPTILVPNTILVLEEGYRTANLLAFARDKSSAIRLLSVDHQLPNVVAVAKSSGTITFRAPEHLPDSHDPTASLGVFRVEDMQGRIAAALSEVIVVPVNDPPVIGSDDVYTSPGQTIEIYPLVNDRDPEGDEIFITHVDASGVGKASFRPEKITLSVAHDVPQGSRLQFTVADGHGGQRIGSIKVHLLFIRDYNIERKMPSGNWILETRQIWTNDQLRWTPVLNRNHSLPVERTVWNAMSPDGSRPGEPNEITFATSTGGKSAIGNPGTGVWTISPTVTFGTSAFQSGFSTRYREYGNDP